MPDGMFRRAYQLPTDELIVDLFAGGGGASEGIFQALGRHPDIAINHDDDAIAVHTRNHPTTLHHCASIWKVHPLEACGDRPVGLLWASPSCTHFSRAAGGVPKSKQLRSLPGVVLTWAKYVRPRVICVENVGEMIDWGPLLADGTPCQLRKGRSFKCWVGRLRGLGYKVEWKMLRAADYGVPTIRTRLFVIARCDGQPIVWPQPTHHKSPSLFEEPWRTAGECIDWSIPCPSIFDRKRPLAEATLARIAEGIQKYVIGAKEPYIVDRAAAHISSFYGASVGSGMDQPVGTVTAGSGHQALVSAHLAPITHPGPGRGSSMADPVPTITCANRGEQALIGATLAQVGWGEREGQAPRALDINKPLGTLVAGGIKHGLVSAVLTGCGGRAGQSPPKPLTEPSNTITAKADQVLATAFLAQHNGGNAGHDVREPFSTILSGGHHQQVVELQLSQDDTARAERVAAFLIQYYSSGKRGQSLFEPLGAATTKGRFALVMVRGVPYPIVDIGMRMLAVHELQAAQGFRPDYDMTDDGRITKTGQVKLIGNSVCPGVAAAVIRANVRPVEAPVQLAA